MIFIDSSFPSVDTTAFQISPLKIDFKFKSLSNGEIIIDEGAAIRSVSKVYLKRKQEKTPNQNYRKTPALAKVQDSSVLDSVSTEINTIADSSLMSSIDTIAADSSTILVTGEKGDIISSPKNDWMVGVGLFVLFLLAVLRFSFSKYLQRVLDSILNFQVSNNLFLEKNMRNFRGSIFLNLLFFVNTTLFAVQYYDYYHLPEGNSISFLVFIYSFTGLLFIYLGKVIVVRSIGYIFDGIKEGKEYLHTIFIYNKNLGMLLLPVTLSVPFIAESVASFLLNAGLIIALLFYLLRLFRGIKILFRKHVSIFYMILYLCALEILPLLVIYKLLKSLV